jgi:RHS repeat-associated protein
VYCYDKGNRLVQILPASGTAYTFTYDGSTSQTNASADGNLTSGAAAGTLAYTNKTNEITTSGWTYDHDGNLTADPSNGTLAYNDAGQLISATAASGGGAGSAAETFTYAGGGQNQPLSDGSATSITYGLADPSGEPAVDSYTTGGGTSYVIRDPQGNPLGIIRGGKSYMYLTDNLGSVITLIGTDGNVDGAYAWTPYGTLTAKSAGNGGSLVTQNLIGYTGELTDTYTSGSTGYIHDGTRWYNPRTGSFASQDANSYLADPANGNRFAYAGDNPANYTDPTGYLAINFSVSACFIGCVEAAVSVGTGGASSTWGYGGGVAAGPEAALTASSGDGTADGSGWEGDCEAGAITGGINSAGETGGGVASDSQVGCELYFTHSHTFAHW